MRQKINLPTLHELSSILEYRPAFGVFIWKHRPDMPKQWNIRYAGKTAGVKMPVGYIIISILKKRYYAHRLAAVFMGWDVNPEIEVDHINGDKSDNRICNLRLATRSQNMRNRAAPKTNKVGLKGAMFNKEKGKWQSFIKINGKANFLGYFDTPEQAHLAYSSRAKDLHGEFLRLS